MSFKQDKPERLKKVSHLFLSGESKKSRPNDETEVIVWIDFPEFKFNRAYFAAGFAYAFARYAETVTIVETGRGLPNCGYYFSLEPAEYLRPLVDERAIVSGFPSEGIRYIYSNWEGNNQILSKEFPPASFPHFILQAFSYPRRKERGELIQSLKMASGHYSFSNTMGGPLPEVLLLVEDVSSPCRRIVEMYKQEEEDIIILYVHLPGDFVCEEAEDNVSAPAPCLWGGYRRIPPSHSYFDSLSTRIVQMVSTRRRKKNERII
jgi:hypothetical protein